MWLQDRDGIAAINPLPEELIPEQWMTHEALNFMDDQEAKRPDDPFFLHLSYFPPHHPYMPIKKYAADHRKGITQAHTAMVFRRCFSLEKSIQPVWPNESA